MPLRVRDVATLSLLGLLAGCLVGEVRPAGHFASPPGTLGNQVVRLPGLEYEVLGSGSLAGPRPLRSDDVEIRYVGRLADGTIFSTSAENGMLPSAFSVRNVIPGFSALVQLMRPGDRWLFKIPAYLGYGHAGRRYTAPEPTLKADIPPGSDLTFDVELVSIAATKK